VAKEDKKARSIEVAALAQASPSTVSRALAGDKRISKATRERVLAAAQELSYQPNLIARSLKNRSTGIVGVVVTDLGNMYHAHTLKLLIDEMGARSLAPLVFACNATEGADAVISRLMSYQVDAVIALAAPFSADIVRSCKAGGKPLVLMNRYDGPEEVSIVSGDSVAGGAMVAEHLVERGARSFAFFAGDDSTLISQDRERGFSERLAELGHSCTRRATSSYSYTQAQKAADQLLQDPPDAVFCANDTLAFALMDMARKKFGYAIPDDLMVVGYDNSGIATWPSYDLTSVDQSLSEMASQTVATTLAMVGASDTTPICKVVAPLLIHRGSTSSRNPN
jgi:DNA-binding LacI/PurR family transcriptional regulator